MKLIWLREKVELGVFDLKFNKLNIYLITNISFIYFFYLITVIILSSCQEDNTSINDTRDANQGQILWQKDNLGDNLESAPAIDEDGNVYVIGGGILYSFSPEGIKMVYYN